jgi:hypothetical protein
MWFPFKYEGAEFGRGVGGVAGYKRLGDIDQVRDERVGDRLVQQQA